MGMQTPWHNRLSRRERQIMDILFRLGRAPASVVREELPGDPSSSTVRTQLRILERKGHVRHEEEGLRYVYRPVTPPAGRAPVGVAAPSSRRSSTGPPSRQ